MSTITVTILLHFQTTHTVLTEWLKNGVLHQLACYGVPNPRVEHLLLRHDLHPRHLAGFKALFLCLN